MSKRGRVVIDTSTLIGAVLRPDSVPQRALLAAVRLYELCMRQSTWDELQAVMRRLVSSDADLLVLHPWSSVLILTPASFLATASAH